MIGNNWENVGDESTIEILEDFNINQIISHNSKQKEMERAEDMPL